MIHRQDLLAEQRKALRLRAPPMVETHWPAADGSPGGRSLKVLDSDARPWLVVPDGSSADLWPATPTVVLRLLSGPLPTGDELDR